MNIIPFRMAPPPSGFTGDDLRAFSHWEAGSNRVEIDDASDIDPIGQFAMIYEGANPWASWAIGREGIQIVLWDCISLQTLGRFASVRAALAAIPGAPVQSDWQPMAEIIPLRPFLNRPSPVAVRSALTLHQ